MSNAFEMVKHCALKFGYWNERVENREKADLLAHFASVRALFVYKADEIPVS